MGVVSDILDGGIRQKCRYLAENAEPLDVAGAALMCTINAIAERGRESEIFTEADMGEVSDLLEIAKVQAAGIADLQRAEDKFSRVEKAFQMLEHQNEQEAE
jgi:hypothetical protein